MLSSCRVFCTVQRHTRCIDVIFSDCHRYTYATSWSDRVTNNEVLPRADMPSIEAMLLSRQLTWTGHLVQMNDDRLPKTVLYGELWQAKRNVGRRHLRYMDKATPPRRRYQQESLGGDGARSQCLAYTKPKEQPMPKLNDNAAMNARSRLQIEQISNQSSHVDTAEGN